jgi:transposase-like protein
MCNECDLCAQPAIVIKLRTGHLEQLPSGLTALPHIWETDPLAAWQRYLKSGSVATEDLALIELGKLVERAAEGQAPEIAPDERAPAAALEEFAAAWGERYPAIVRVWRANWAEFTPFLAFPRAVRRVIYTTSLIESVNARPRKVTRNRGWFPSEQAALKVLYLAVRSLEDYRAATSKSGAPGGNRPWTLSEAG